MKVRLYGPTIGHGSFVRVADGMRQGLEACDALAGFVPIDALGESASYGGHDAAIGVYVGPPPGASVMSSHGWHESRLCLIAPNSTWLPQSMLDALTFTRDVKTFKPYVTGFISPSTWGSTILKQYTKLPIHLWHHGIDERFAFAGDRQTRWKTLPDGLSALHLASTPNERKGTRELIVAWGRLVAKKALGKNPMLNMVIDGASDDIRSFVEKKVHTEHLETIRMFDRQGLSVEDAAKMYSVHHVTIQPSRAEGFGMCLNESRACGTPVVATNATGHRDQLSGEFGTYCGVAAITVEDIAPIDDGPGACAPIVLPSDIESAIGSVYRDWTEYESDIVSEQFRTKLLDNWSWKAVTKRWLEEMEMS